MGRTDPKALGAWEHTEGKRIDVLCGLRERTDWYTEADVVLDFDESIIFIEATLTSENDRKRSDYSGWKTYVNDSAFRNPDSAVYSELYQLTRNRRIAYELVKGRSFRVINLAASFERKQCRQVAMFRSSIEVTRERRLNLMTWKEACALLKSIDWLDAYGQERGLCSNDLA